MPPELGDLCLQRLDARFEAILSRRRRRAGLERDLGGGLGRRLLPELVLEPILLLPWTPFEPRGVAALDEVFDQVLDVFERAHARHAIAARLELARSLRTAQQQDRQDSQLIAAETQRFLGQMAVLDRTAAMATGEARKPIAGEPGGGLPHGCIVVVGHGITVGRLIAGEPEGIERQRVLVRGRPPLLDQAAKHTLFRSGELTNMHGARIDARAGWQLQTMVSAAGRFDIPLETR